MVKVMTETLYGSTYQVVVKCPECDSTNWYNLTATEHIMCLDCGHQENLMDCLFILMLFLFGLAYGDSEGGY